MSMAPGVWERLAKVRSTEFTPVPPAVVVRVERPSARESAPRVSVEAVWARPR